MGLSAPRRRTKFAHDPNNTHWTQSSTKYGQRILESQGWKSGDAIGKRRQASTDPQSVFARLAVKDGNLGLGARNVRGVDEEPTGLADFQDLLGRLNGKSEVSIQRTQQVRGELARHRYLERRGTIAFVKGGYMEHDELKEIERLKQNSTDGNSHGTRKYIHIDPGQNDAIAKTAKRQRKEQRREQKRLKKLAAEDEAAAPILAVIAQVDEVPSPVTAAQSQPSCNRNFARSRYIRQKQLAISDPKALNEILMIKP